MKVLFANKFFFRNGGSEAVMFQERAYLQHVGMEVVDFSMEDPRNSPSEYNSYFVANQSYKGRQGIGQQVRTAINFVHSREAVRNIANLIEETRPDIVHCHNIYHQLTPSIINVAKRYGVPVVLTVHDYKPICPVYTRLRHGRLCSECDGNKFLNVVRHRCAEGSLTRSMLLYAEALAQGLMKSYENLDTIIAPSKFMRDAMVRNRFAPERVKVLANGVDTDQIRPSDEDLGYVLYFGRLVPEKGLETLLEAHQRSGMGRLVIVGTGPMEVSLREHYPNAEFLGHLSGNELVATIRAASFIVVPSEWYENCPMTILESMAYGKAVVASAIGGIPELVEDGVTGVLFPPGDAQALAQKISNLLRDPNLCKSLGKAARERAETRFSLDRHNRELLHIYESTIRS